MGSRDRLVVFLNPFSPFSTAKVLTLKATVLLQEVGGLPAYGIDATRLPS